MLGYRASGNSAHIHWVRACIGGLLAELTVFAIVFPARSLFGQRAFLASILVASAIMPFVFAMWVCRRVESRFVLHGALVGIVAMLFYLGLAWGQPQPLLYRIAHGLKVVGGVAGGVVASWRRNVAIAFGLKTSERARGVPTFSVVLLESNTQRARKKWMDQDHHT